MKDKKFYRDLMKIALPMTIQYFIASSLNLIDSFMIGKLGEEAVAALGIANQYFFLCNIILMGVYSGCNVLICQYWGKKDMGNIKKLLGISLSVGIPIGLVFTMGGKFFGSEIVHVFNKNENVIALGASYLKMVSFGYLIMSVSFAFAIGSRGVENTVLPMACSAAALVVNVVLNYGLIFGNLGMPEMGIEGAALATLMARCVEMVLIVSLVYLKNHPLKSTFKELFAFDSKFFNHAMKITIPVVINELCWGAGMIVYSIIYGNMGTRAIAAVQICISVQNIFLIVMFSMSAGAGVMVGNQVGANDEDKARDYSKKLMKVGIIMSIILAAALFASSSHILKIYDVSDEVYRNSLYMLYITAAIIPVRFINVMLIVGIFRGGGDTSYALKIELVTMWLVGVPICIIGAKFLNIDVYQVYLLVTLEEIIKCIISLKRYKSGSWIRNLTETDTVSA